MNSSEHTNANERLAASGHAERSGAQHVIHRPSSIVHGQSSIVCRPSSIVLLAIVIAAVALPGCLRKPDNTAEAAGKKPGAIAGGAATAVTAAPAVVNDITKTVDVTGSLVALQDVIVGAKIAGKVQAVYFHEGDTVSAGQVVAMMDLADFQNNVLQQQANLQSAITKEQQAEAALMQARNTLDQAKNAVRNGETTLKWMDKTTTTAVQSAKSSLASAEENLSMVKEGARDQERKQAEEAVASAKANFEKARSDLKRYQSLYREQAVSQSQLDEKQAAFDSAQANYNSALQALSLIREGARPQDIRRADLAVQVAREALVKAESDRSQVAMKEDDLRTAKSNVATAQSGIRSAEAGVAAAKAGVRQVQAALRISQDALSEGSVKAPISGIVAERRVEPGQQIGAGGALMRIVSPKSVYLQAILSESQYADVRLGMRTDVTIDAVPGSTYRGSVTRILPVASSVARSFTVRIDFPGDSRLRPQMFARGSIVVATHKQTTLVPKDAVIFDPTNNSARVFLVASGGTAEERTVKVGYSNPQFIEALSGVKPGDKVVTAGQNILQNGDKIRVQ